MFPKERGNPPFPGTTSSKAA